MFYYVSTTNPDQIVGSSTAWVEIPDGFEQVVKDGEQRFLAARDRSYDYMLSAADDAERYTAQVAEGLDPVDAEDPVTLAAAVSRALTVDRMEREDKEDDPKPATKRKTRTKASA